MSFENTEKISSTINDLSKSIYKHNSEVGWWDDLEKLRSEREDILDFIDDHEDHKSEVLDSINTSINLIITQKLALIHSEISEALEGLRKDLKDDHLPQYDMFAVELADALIRILDLAGAFNIPIGNIMMEKWDYNTKRVDHTREHRSGTNGKKF
ncbi:hypothetical protein BGI05_08345 [Snodgrassella alvi]|uniref:hypothetical protein n=1 Tax=Snodgrassella alvi TaxID=1196083 RepID=UPI0009FFD72D|nr:hypothetical protein [Snodgrassella alvi]ORF01477.1 hypothetical protein BGH97_07040 [Snodgrassella alvi]ORF08761.1 hypothetical protein BGH99_04740 [Snodgrassella alvi]ORF12859.1 hypothetical protein BGI00_04990 [Snodgrassella alvi]ORF13398.1 hypothetical protein BGI02_07305 [Snodgrassella alvi]ORF19346.1 hypothetical protein BGI05_08345 [Snodgrassella alvi]